MVTNHCGASMRNPAGVFFLLSLSALAAGKLFAGGDGTFQSPFRIVNAGRPGPATVHSGDFNGDGKLDLATANGSPNILVFLQNPSNRLEWKQVPLQVGSQVWFVRSADFTGDGVDDLIAGDISATAFFIRSRGDGTFERPVPLADSWGARWTAVGDWNRDGNMDVATANISNANLTIYLGDGAGKFTLSQKLPGSREHTLEALDYDGDGILDLMLGTGLDGLIPHHGKGDGTFEARESFKHMGCVEYLAEVGHFRGKDYILWGDFNKDGKGDLAPTCIETTSASAGISRGDATYEETLETAAGPDVDSTAIADLSDDGNPDLAIASKGSTAIRVYLGKGDGRFLPEPVLFGPTGNTPSFLIARDLDADGFIDLISADTASSSLTLLWGRKGERFLESSFNLEGHPPAKAMAAADLDRDGAPDLFIARADQPEVHVYLKPGKTLPKNPSLVIQTEARYGLLEASDLDGDGTPDLAGADPVGGKALVALLEAAGKARQQLALDAGVLPSAVLVARIDEGPTPDLAIPCKGSNHVAIFLNQGGGSFAAARILPTIDKPKGAVLGDADGDALADLVVFSDVEVTVHSGRGDGNFLDAQALVHDDAKTFTAVALGDVTGDQTQDLLVTEAKTASVLIFAKKGDPPIALKTIGAPNSIVLADLDGDGLLDITAASESARSASVFLNQGPRGFPDPPVYGLGIKPLAHLLLDLDLDGALDLAAFSASAAVVLFGRPNVSAAPLFRRGDVSADGDMAITDPILILHRLFLGGEPLPCEDAADADDDGLVQMNDAILILISLFLGGGPLPPPGPDACGEDVKPDGLACDAGCP
ncbi:MAG: VCBS repeat-containing protein [Planctomycetes bacterium]|nr:VCBS repeat-containing protein [Planctomycetota bacterium]